VKDSTLVQVVFGVHAGMLAMLSFTHLDISIIAGIALVDAVAFAVLIVGDILAELYEP
jgi:hypothetical protein